MGFGQPCFELRSRLFGILGFVRPLEALADAMDVDVDADPLVQPKRRLQRQVSHFRADAGQRGKAGDRVRNVPAVLLVANCAHFDNILRLRLVKPHWNYRLGNFLDNSKL